MSLPSFVPRTLLTIRSGTSFPSLRLERPRSCWLSRRELRQTRCRSSSLTRSEEHTSELQSRQYLHSFPTRRSSDLGPHDIRTRRLHPAFHEYSDACHCPVSCPGHCLRSDQGLRSHRCGWNDLARAGCLDGNSGKHAAGVHRLRDRKSTRLNSSHANIFTLSLHDALPI